MNENKAKIITTKRLQLRCDFKKFVYYLNSATL